MNEFDFPMIWRYRLGKVVSDWKVIEERSETNDHIKILDLKNELSDQELANKKEMIIELATKLPEKLQSAENKDRISRIQSLEISNSATKMTVNLLTILIMIFYSHF